LSVSFSEDLKHQNIDKWNKILNHKFVIEIGEDILPKSKFVFYLKQDQIFLESFCNLLATTSRIAYDKETKEWIGSLLDSTTRYEMPMQREIIHQLEGDLKSIEFSPEKTTIDYISYLEIVSDSEDFAIIISTMAPCPWTYNEISLELVSKDVKSETFKQWIRFYSSKESGNQAIEIKQLLDGLAMNSEEKKKVDMKNHFSISCNYEIEFWNMAYSYGI
jgi:thiaminase (transcriptional activator TenA)